MANVYDINVKQGSTFKLVLTCKDPLDVPIDITGYTFRGQIRTSYSDPTIQAAFTCVVRTQTGGDVGKVDCVISAVDAAGIKVPEAESPTRKITKMIYDIESDNGGGEVVRWLEGAANISPEVTR